MDDSFSFLDLKSESSFYTDLMDNTCAGAKLAADNQPCVNLNVPQAGANITKGYVGNLDMGEVVPNTKPYFQSSMCPVNVHWHLGTEHYSAGEYDENGDGPHGNQIRPDWSNRDLAEGGVRDGFRCNHYEAQEEKFTQPYEWKYCEGMEVGETYEVHWPHSAAGACGTVNQYQTPFYDGVFCNLPMDAFVTLGAQDIASAVGVHAQVYTIVNDEEFFYADMIRGMIIDGDMGQDIAYYTGSTTGTSRDNEMCSMYAPITWQVDRKCHMISASSFDKMCYDMMMMRDDMSGDLHAHGARELVHDDYSANNQYYPEAEVAAVEEAAPAAEEEGDLADLNIDDEAATATAEERSGPFRDLAAATTTAVATSTGDAESLFLEQKTQSAFYTDLMDNTCAGAKLAFDNKLCADINVPQAGANVTKGYVGNLDVGEIVPNTKPYFQSGMCPVNVHWHLGTEHYSAGEYDENGDGPHGNQALPEWSNRDLAEGGVRDGFRCNHYDANEEKFTKDYEWKHCEGMEVGETYEVHWPHSAAGACGTVNQYQTPFYDGVFCNLPMEAFVTLGAQDIASAVGVHAQAFTIVNDEDYYYGNMINGMIVDKDMGKDIHIYTGSTTGTSRDNEMCSQYAPITWQVDRKCHMISASSFDKMCFDMKMMRDDMSGDLHAHGARELVHHDYSANNPHYPDGDRKRKNLRA